MKSNVRVIILALTALTFLGWYQVLGVTLETRTEYEQLLEKANAYCEEGAIEKALDTYTESLELKDTIEVRKQMDMLFGLCMEDGSVRYGVSEYEDFLSRMLRAHAGNAYAYELNTKYWFEQGKYLKCNNILQKAEKNEVESEILTAYKQQVKYKCKLDSTRYSDFKSLSNGLFAVQTTDVWNYMNASGSARLEGDFEKVQPFNEDLAIVHKNGSMRIIDKSGTVQCILDSSILSSRGCFGDALAPVETITGCVYIDTEGVQKLGPYDDASVFCKGIAAVKREGKWMLIDTEGNAILDGFDAVALDSLGRCSSQGIIIAAKDGKFGLYTLEGNRIGQESYEDADAFGNDGIAAVCKEGNWGYIDMKGNWVIPPQYIDAKSFSNGVAGICQEESWGFIDQNGEVIISCVYEDVDYWNEEGSCMVKEGGFWKLLEWICH